jgi:hypothetical protein
LGLVDPASGQKFVYAAATVGGHIAVDELKESVVTMRLLRGIKCMPIIEPGEKPMKTRFKLGSRPYFKIVGLKELGGGQPALPPGAPQIEGPGGKTLDAMGDVKEPTTEEIIDDQIPSL